MTDPMRILVIGRSGQVGSAFAAIADGDAECAWHFAARDTVDLGVAGQGRRKIESLTPDVVINTAAYTAVDRAETDSALARAVNADAPGELAAACHDTGAALVHYSTDYVFDGSGTRPYLESDATAPLGIYGQTKWEGEEQVRAALSRHVILRTAWVYDAFGQNFVNTMLRLASERDELGVVADQRGSPTFAPDLAAATHRLVAQLPSAEPGVFGTYHATGGGETTWHGFAARIFERAGVDIKLNAIDSSSYPTPAPRPAYSVLDNARLAGLGIALPHWHDALDRCLAIRQAGASATG